VTTTCCRPWACLLGLVLCACAMAAAPLPERYLNREDSRRVIGGYGSSIDGDATRDAVKKQLRRHQELLMRVNPAMKAEVFQEIKRLQDAGTRAAKSRRAELLGRAGYFLQEKDIAELVGYFKGIPNPGPRDSGGFAAGMSVAAIRGMKAGQAQLRKISGYTFWAELSAPLSRRQRVQLYEAALREMSFSPTFPELRKRLALSGFSEAEQKSLKETLAIADEMHREYAKTYPFVYKMLPEWHKRKNLSAEAPWLADLNAPSVLPAKGAAVIPEAAAADTRISKPVPDSSAMQELSPGPSARAETIVKEGVSAYGQLLDMLFAEQHRFLIEQIMDNGKPVPEAKKKKKKGFDGFVQAIQTQKVLLGDVKAKGLLKVERYRDFQVDLSLAARVESLSGDENLPVIGSESVTLLFHIPGTSELFRKHIPQIGGPSAEKTITPEGDLQVYMKRINGKWYWNPFGW